MKNIQAALQGITIANGYATTLNAVERALQQGQSTTPPMAYVLEGDDSASVGPLSGNAGLIRRDLQVGIILVVQQDTDLDVRSASEAMNSLIADVQKKLQEDYTRGGLAVNTEETNVSAMQIEEGMPVLSCTVTVQVHYRHNRLDPTLAG